MPQDAGSGDLLLTARETIERARLLLRDEYGQFYDDLEALLFRHDPIHINFKTNTDEYDPEVRAILPRLSSCASAADVARMLHEVFVQFFTATSAGPLSRYEPIAAEVWERWLAR